MDRPYNDQKRFFYNSLFGTSDFYSFYLNKLGNNAEEFIANNLNLQKKWAEENIIRKQNIFFRIVDTIIPKIPYYRHLIPTRNELEILSEQINKFKPDVIYNQNLGYLDPIFLRSIKSKAKLLVGQIASPPPPKIFLKPYDLIITSFPHFVKKFKKMGIRSEYLKLCFDTRVLKKLKKYDRKLNLTFVGGITNSHQKSLDLLENVAKETELKVWGYGRSNLDINSELYKSHNGEAWGVDMYKIMLQSKITINRHIDVAENYANNMRLYEATGCGAMLLTDEKQNLGDLFEVGKEVVTYKDKFDLIEKVQYYLSNNEEREKIAKAGQKRTFIDHTYKVRMRELETILNKYV